VRSLLVAIVPIAFAVGLYLWRPDAPDAILDSAVAIGLSWLVVQALSLLDPRAHERIDAMSKLTQGFDIRQATRLP
jgi:hypothetical protein